MSDFVHQVRKHSLQQGMPKLRVQYVQGPVWGKTREQLRKVIVEGINPVNNKPVMTELVDALTKPLTEVEKRSGEITRTKGPETFTGDRDTLQRMFLNNRWTDYLPVVLPTEEKVNEMLAGTSHDPDKVVGRMAPYAIFEKWSYTVRDVAVNAVMAGAKPEYFPVILAIASTGKEGISVSDNGFVAGLVINGPIRDEIGLNYDIGALGPFGHANVTIGRAWNLLSINGGNCGKAGTTYMGTVGNPMNLMNIIIAENEEASPWRSFAVRKGYKKHESVISIFEGWGVLSSKNWKANVWGKKMDYPGTINKLLSQQDHMFGGFAVLSPNIANFVKDDGFDSVNEFKSWLMRNYIGQKSPWFNASAYTIIVTGASNNNYYSLGGMRYQKSVRVDDWR